MHPLFHFYYLLNKQNREIHSKKKRVFVLTITLPEDPSTGFIFAEETTIERQVRRLESMIHVFAVHHSLSRSNNVHWAIVKNADVNVVDCIRVKLEFFADANSNLIIEKEYTLAELTETETLKSSSHTLQEQIKLRIPFPFSFNEMWINFIF